MCKSTFTSTRKSEVVFLFTPMASHISPSSAFINAVLPEPAGPDTTRSPGNKPAVSKLSLNVVNALIICHQKVNIERLSLTHSLAHSLTHIHHQAYLFIVCSKEHAEQRRLEQCTRPLGLPIRISGQARSLRAEPPPHGVALAKVVVLRICGRLHDVHKSGSGLSEPKLVLAAPLLPASRASDLLHRAHTDTEYTSCPVTQPGEKTTSLRDDNVIRSSEL
jgi:hypothetical protein